MKRIVTIGGGTGSYTILSGIKDLPNISLTALVSMADDGGSTGILRDELGVLPPGDVRQCLVALSEHTDIVRSLMGYRFSEGTLAGHSFGNIFLAALEKVTGDFGSGVSIASEILKVKGKVIPITTNKAELRMVMKDDSCLKGEHCINSSDIQTKGMMSVAYAEDVRLNIYAKEAIMSADSIILGPGNYYCSILPNLLVSGCREAIQSTQATLIFPVNLTNKHGHTLHWKVSDYVKDIESHLGRAVDIIVVNNHTPSEEQIMYYKMEEGDGVLTIDDMKDDPRVVRENLLSHTVIVHSSNDKVGNLRSFIRHDKDKLRAVFAKILGV